MRSTLLLIAAVAVSAGCGGDDGETAATPPRTATTPTSTPTPPDKTGLALGEPAELAGQNGDNVRVTVTRIARLRNPPTERPKQGKVFWQVRATIENLEQGEPIRFNLTVEARVPLIDPTFAFHCNNAEGVEVFVVHQPLSQVEGQPNRLEAGQRVRLSGKIENPLSNGRYDLTCMIVSHDEAGMLNGQELKYADFVVYGPKLIVGAVEVGAEIGVEAEIDGR